MLLQGTVNDNVVSAIEISRDALRYTYDIIVSLGPLCAYEAANILIKNIGKLITRSVRRIFTVTLRDSSM